MLCQECRLRPASVKVTAIIGGQKREVHLCDACAQSRGEVEFGGEAKISIGEMLAALLHQHGMLHPAATGAPDIKCDNCGLSFDGFTKTGKLGCSECFTKFDEQLKHVLRHIHGSARHVGRMPRRAGGTLRLKRQMQALRDELAACVQAEQFERAAELRDRIKDLEAAEGGRGNGPKS
ncbi:MAG: UvrB/UvrC motif-containing protein [Bacillota bacterium]|nr:UvrB/UvrC motif-containing protein [Bacillota bacterium]